MYKSFIFSESIYIPGEWLNILLFDCIEIAENEWQKGGK